MARITQTVTIITDDLTGREIDEKEATEHEVDFQGETYVIETTKKNAERLDTYIVEVLTGNRPLPHLTNASGSTKSKGRASGKSANTYGLDFKKVRQWAIDNGLKAKNGEPITERTRRISDEIYQKASESGVDLK